MLDNYTDLKAAIVARINHSEVADNAEDFIRIAEDDIARWLKVTWNESRAYATPTSAFIELPPDYLAMRSIQWDSGGYRYTLEQLSPHLADQESPSTAAGFPRYYTVQDGQIELRPAPAGSNTSTLTMTYYYRPAYLSDLNLTNEIIDNAPNLLLYRSLAEAADFVFDDQRHMKYMTMYEKTKQEVIKEDSKRKWSGSPLRVRPDSMGMI